MWETSIAKEFGLQEQQVSAVLKLFKEGATVPFMARYRKEATGGLDEVQIRDIQERFEYLTSLAERKETVLRSIREQDKLTPELEARIQQCDSKVILEDIYLPYKPKKRTRGQIAEERGLAPLAEQLWQGQTLTASLEEAFTALVGTHADLTTKETVAQGIQDWIAEKISEIPSLRAKLRAWILDTAVLRTYVREHFKDKKTKYENYYNYIEPLKQVLPHRLMAIRRAEKEEIIRIEWQLNEEEGLVLVTTLGLPAVDLPSDVRAFLHGAAKESYERLLKPGLEAEVRLQVRAEAEEEAIRVFSKNLKGLLLLPPMPERIVLGIDPGLRTGSKLVVIDKTGKLLEFSTIYPRHESDFSDPKNQASAHVLNDLLRRHGVSVISIGNGTAGREMEAFVEKLLEQQTDLTVRVIMVNESGASVYSASDVAREEFPDLDITYRGAVSIARRLQDPLAELVKIDPKSIGVGQYQHDVNQARLKKKLEEVVESCVNYVGVHLNTASPSLLSYVAGIGPHLAKNIVNYRQSHGVFQNRTDLLEIPGFGPKTFEQAAGFLKIFGGPNPLDSTAVHPERYGFIENLSMQMGIPLKDLLGKKEVLSQLKLQDYVNDSLGLPTLQDIIAELLKPGRDPREDHTRRVYHKDIRDFSQLKEGQILTGTITNVTNFGAFVDIGVHQDGLVHISEATHGFVKDASLVFSVGDVVKVKVIGLDTERKRISLSCKACQEPSSNIPKRPQSPKSQEVKPQNSHRPKDSAPRPPKGAPATQTPATLQDLLAKFGAGRA